MTQSMTKRQWWLFIPLALFLVGAYYLWQGLFSDPRKLESVLVGQPVPDFVLQDLHDLTKTHDKTIFTQRPKLLNVWATWCPTCYQEHEYLKTLAKEGILIIGMNYKDDRAKAIQWLKQLDNPYAINLYDPDGMLGLDLGVYGAPETFLIDSQGIIRYRHAGDVNPKVWAETLQPIFAKME